MKPDSRVSYAFYCNKSIMNIDATSPAPPAVHNESVCRRIPAAKKRQNGCGAVRQPDRADPPQWEAMKTTGTIRQTSRRTFQRVFVKTHQIGAVSELPRRCHKYQSHKLCSSQGIARCSHGHGKNGIKTFYNHYDQKPF